MAVLRGVRGCLDWKYLVKYIHILVRRVKLDPTPEGSKIGGIRAAHKSSPLDGIVVMVDHAINKATLGTTVEVQGRLQDPVLTNMEMSAANVDS